jgi:hypothetical protein
MKDKEGNTKHYEVSYSQILQKRANKLLTILIILIATLILSLAYTLIKVDLLDIPTRMIYGG